MVPRRRGRRRAGNATRAAATTATAFIRTTLVVIPIIARASLLGPSSTTTSKSSKRKVSDFEHTWKTTVNYFLQCLDLKKNKYRRFGKAKKDEVYELPKKIRMNLGVKAPKSVIRKLLTEPANTIRKPQRKTAFKWLIKRLMKSRNSRFEILKTWLEEANAEMYQDDVNDED